jgi:hypothetical protein
VRVARYSYSKLNTYGTCPLQYRFRSIDKIRIEVAPEPPRVLRRVSYLSPATAAATR